MSDVIRSTPRALCEAVRWKPAHAEVPDTDRTVLVCVPEAGAEEVWLGWWDAQQQCFMDASSAGRLRMVTWWAERPRPPVDAPPASGPAQDPPHLGCSFPGECSFVGGFCARKCAKDAE
ncbi:MAG: hypothetical protein ACSLE9_03900 [Burkholderiaceae bacterium]